MTYPSILPADMVSLAEQVVVRNREAGRCVALAESCTGGLVASAITEVPGSSSILDRSFVTYSNQSKIQMLGVSSDIIDTFGAVSVACAWEMAKGALAKSGADIAIAVSGIAGPSGGSELKPVGTVVFARALRGQDECEAEERMFAGGSRAAIRHQAALVALELLLP